MIDFLRKLFDTDDFPARWNCGEWSSFHGWLHIGADIATALAYFAIPLLIACLIVKKKGVEFPRLYWLFCGFIFFCGLVHLVEALIFWVPLYRVSALLKVMTAVVSWVTVYVLLDVVPRALRLPDISQLNVRLEEEIRQRALIQAQLERANGRLEAANSRLERQASLDQLTGLANRFALDEALSDAWRSGLREARPVALILIDIDHFKNFNDTYGHLAGDACLRAVSDVVASYARRTYDTAGRFGGEELALVLPNAELEAATQLAELIRRDVEALEVELPEGITSLPRQRPRVTVSLGVTAPMPVHGRQVTALIATADDALYQAKRTGRNRVVVREDLVDPGDSILGLPPDPA